MPSRTCAARAVSLKDVTTTVRPGVGISWTRELEPLLESHAGLIDWIEFEPQTTWLVDARGGPPRASRAVIERLRRAPPRKLVHSVAAPVGGSQRPDAAHLALLREVVHELGAPYLSEHLSFNSAHGVCTGFFLPPRQTETQVRVVADNIRRLQDAVGVPVAIENGTSYLRPRGDEMSDGEFIARVAEAADCGLLLDLHNAYANAVNGRQPLPELLAQLPLHRVWELHLAGGMMRDGFWLDAHSGPVPEPLWQLVHGLPRRLPALHAVVFEMFPTFVALSGPETVVAELRRLHEWLDGPDAVPAPVSPPVVPVLRWATEPVADNDPGDSWEAALTELVTGQRTTEGDDAAMRWYAALASELCVPLLRELVFSFRASMLVQALPLTMRLLLANLGPQPVRVILQDAFVHEAPRLYAALEAEAFADHLLRRCFAVPHLHQVLHYELALARTLIDGQPRVVPFDVEPMPLLRALAEGRLPNEVLQAGRFEVELLPDIKKDQDTYRSQLEH